MDGPLGEAAIVKEIIFDLETTGPNPSEDQIIEIAIQYGFDEGSEIKTRRVNPTIPISPAAQAVHGITMEDLKDCPTFKKLAKGIREVFEEAE
ncbi:MAG: 3'-5' exonuclease, partial [Bdellovibrionales bacterium]|nr:3'-5' exonuclease [Bdellovibrionales bacterium]